MTGEKRATNKGVRYDLKQNFRYYSNKKKKKKTPASVRFRSSICKMANLPVWDALTDKIRRKIYGKYIQLINNGDDLTAIMTPNNDHDFEKLLKNNYTHEWKKYFNKPDRVLEKFTLKSDARKVC